MPFQMGAVQAVAGRYFASQEVIQLIPLALRSEERKKFCKEFLVVVRTRMSPSKDLSGEEHYDLVAGLVKFSQPVPLF